MSTRNISRLHAVAVFGLCLAMSIVVPDVVFAQDRDKAFKDGMEAYDKKEWERVVKLMQEAIRADAQEAVRRVEYGGTFGFREKNTQYTPHYYLGEALFKLQSPDCSGAVAAWARSEAAGIVKNNSTNLRIIQDGYTVCKERGVLPAHEFDPLLKQAAQRFAETVAILVTVDKLRTEYPDLARDAAAGADQARGDLETARRRLTSGQETRTRTDLEEGRRATERALNTLKPLEASLSSALDARKTTGVAAAEAQQALQSAGEVRNQVDSAFGGAGGTASTSAMNAARQRATETLDRGREQLGTGTKTGSQAALIEAKNLAVDAESQFKRLLDDFKSYRASLTENQLSDARTSAGQASKFVEDLFPTLDRRMAANPALATEVASEYADLLKRNTADRRRLEAALGGADAVVIERATRRMLQLRDLLTALTARFGPLTLRERGVSQALEDGAARFLAGQYQEALALLNPAGGFAADDPLQLHVHLFRAASLYAQYAQSRGTNTDLRTQALAEIEECKKIDSAFQPDPRAFSPRFLALYRDGSDGLTAAAP